MASSLSAEFKKPFGVPAKLVEGHNSIYKVTLNEKILYTNHGQCGQLPTNELVLVARSKYKVRLLGLTMDRKDSLPIFGS